MPLKFFSQALWRSPGQNKIGHDLGPFSTSQNRAVLEPRTGHFQVLAGFEAKAEDLTFEAKDFKLCLRGLHLWFRYLIWKVVKLQLQLSQKWQQLEG